MASILIETPWHPSSDWRDGPASCLAVRRGVQHGCKRPVCPATYSVAAMILFIGWGFTSAGAIVCLRMTKTLIGISREWDKPYATSLASELDTNSNTLIVGSSRKPLLAIYTILTELSAILVGGACRIVSFTLAVAQLACDTPSTEQALGESNIAGTMALARGKSECPLHGWEKWPWRR